MRDRAPQRPMISQMVLAVPREHCRMWFSLQRIPSPAANSLPFLSSLSSPPPPFFSQPEERAGPSPAGNGGQQGVLV